MRSPALVAAAVRSRSAQVLAAMLVVLAISPLTEPFLTFDLADLFSTGVSASGSIAATKTAESFACVLVVASTMVLLVGASVVRRPMARVAAAGDVRSSVLRI